MPGAQNHMPDPQCCPFCGQLLPKHISGRPKKPVDLDRARGLFAQGLSIRGSARQMGLGIQTLLNAIRAAGIDYRASPRAKLAARLAASKKRPSAPSLPVKISVPGLDLGSGI